MIKKFAATAAVAALVFSTSAAASGGADSLSLSKRAATKANAKADAKVINNAKLKAAKLKQQNDDDDDDDGLGGFLGSPGGLATIGGLGLAGSELAGFTNIFGGTTPDSP